MEMAFTDAVRDLQSQNGSAEHYTNATVGTPPADAFEADEIDYIQRCDSFYMSSINANGWPITMVRNLCIGQEYGEVIRMIRKMKLAFFSPSSEYKQEPQ